MAKVKYYAKENSTIGTHSFYAVPIPNGTLTFDEFCRAAIAYAVHDVKVIPSTEADKGWWPEKWNADMFKPKDRKRNLVRAGALIAAAIDRLQYEDIDEQ